MVTTMTTTRTVATAATAAIAATAATTTSRGEGRVQLREQHVGELVGENINAHEGDAPAGLAIDIKVDFSKRIDDTKRDSAFTNSKTFDDTAGTAVIKVAADTMEDFRPTTDVVLTGGILFGSTILSMIVSVGGIGVASVLRAGVGLCAHSARVRSPHRRRCWLHVRSAIVGLAVMSLGGAKVSAAECAASTCCNVAIPKLDPLKITKICSSRGTSIGSAMNQCSASELAAGTCSRVCEMGTIPPSIGGLVKLTSIFLSSSTSISGTLPGDELEKLVDLQTLSIYYTKLSGVIPAGAGKLAKLTILHVFKTKISGVLPESIRTRLQTGALYMMHNSLIGTFTGRIEDLINSLPATQSAVQVGYEVTASVSGTLPATVGGLTKLTSLILGSSTAISGSIPKEIGALVTLTYLGLTGTKIEGTVPGGDLGKLVNLQKLDLSAMGKLSGSIPNEIGSLVALTGLLSFKNTKIEGTIPTGIGALVALTSLSFENTQVDGSLPGDLGKLVNLQALNIQFCYKLSGTIPPSIGQLVKLTSLRTFSAGLSGVIPASIGNLVLLEFLDLLDNSKLSGSIPLEIGALVALTYLSVGNTKVEGASGLSKSRDERISVIYTSEHITLSVVGDHRL
jgi:Leucine-rich repeat (LRR) protein